MSRSAALYRAARLTGLPALLRLRDGAVVFCFHNVVPDAAANAVGDGPLHCGVSHFEAIADWLAHAFRVVPVDDILARLRDGRPLRGLAALTFDDGYAGVLRHALPVLRARGLPASLFVVSDAPAAPGFFWWDRLGHQADLDSAQRLRCLDDLAGDDRLIRAEFPHRDGTGLPADLLPGTWDELRAAGGDGVRFESHTRTHPNLTRLPLAAVRDELTQSRRAIAEQLGREPTIVSYPFGFVSPDVAAVAREAGFAGGLALSFGRVSRGTPIHSVVRINVPAGLSIDALACWSAGLRWNPPR